MFWNTEEQFSLIPKEVLEKSDKILFICYLAIGDFAYLQTCFKKLHEQYPNLKIDFWADEYRGRSKIFRWQSKKNDILYEWVESTPYFNKFYKNIGPWWNLNKFITTLKQENYPVVISLLCSNRQNNIAKYARQISPKGYLVGVSDNIVKNPISLNIGKHYLNKFDRFYLNTKKFNPNLPIMDYFANSFEALFGFKIKNDERKSFISIPEKWQTWSKEQVQIYKSNSQGKLIFINIFAKQQKRCWTPQKAIELVKTLKQDSNFENSVFLINSMPDQREKLDQLFKKYFSKNIFLFTANKSFFQLPSILALCDLVISVDTSIVHLSNALSVPLVDLVRQKNADWIPQTEKCVAVGPKTKGAWVKEIDVADVVEATKSLLD